MTSAAHSNDDDARPRLSNFLNLLAEMEAVVEGGGIEWSEGIGIDVGRRMLNLAARIGMGATQQRGYV